MERKNVMKWASLFVVALFFAATVTITSADTGVDHQQQMGGLIMQQSQSYIQPGTQYFDEEIQYPDQLPVGTSSLTWIRARRAFNPWEFPHPIYEVGFSEMVMRLRDGPTHTWNFDGQVVITYSDGTFIVQPVHDQMVWNGHIVSNFDIVPGGFHDLGYFSTAHLTGTVTKDIGNPEYKDRWFYGGQFYGCSAPGGGGIQL